MTDVNAAAEAAYPPSQLIEDYDGDRYVDDEWGLDEMQRAAFRAGALWAATQEPEWEYGSAVQSGSDLWDEYPALDNAYDSAQRDADNWNADPDNVSNGDRCIVVRRLRSRPAGPWVPADTPNEGGK
jgi:hypothetical protein